jgi:hypothetical protein
MAVLDVLLNKGLLYFRILHVLKPAEVTPLLEDRGSSGNINNRVEAIPKLC